MNRLRDVVDGEGGTGGDPLFRHGVELLQKTPPTQVAPDTRARVWRAIRRAPARRGLPTLALKLAVAGAVALVAGTAGAVIAQRWIAPRYNKVTDDARGSEPR